MDHTTAALIANMTALAELLADAAKYATEAAAEMAEGKRNLAIGTLLQIEQTVPDAAVIMQATLALHRVAGRR